LPLKNKNTGMVPWDYQIEDENYQKEPWLLKKGMEYVTIEKDNNNKGFSIFKRMIRNVYL
tara:strand:- start:211 stop:390 length:180 start_codon:yes stop_codon:yes gene_type:complete